MREALLSAARDCFGTHGYSATSIDQIVAAVGATKGAFYHHFTSKAQVFGAVFEAEERAITAALTAIDLSHLDPVEALVTGCRAFLDQCSEPLRRRIYLIDGESVLGWEGVRAIEEGSSLELLFRGVVAATRWTGAADCNPRVMARLLFGTLCEAAMAIARDPDPSAVHTLFTAEIERIVRSVVAGKGSCDRDRGLA